jgi:hypothetical protein
MTKRSYPPAMEASRADVVPGPVRIWALRRPLEPNHEIILQYGH